MGRRRPRSPRPPRPQRRPSASALLHLQLLAPADLVALVDQRAVLPARPAVDDVSLAVDGVDGVVALATDDRVGSRTAYQGVIARAAIQLVVAGSAAQLVLARLPLERVVA